MGLEAFIPLLVEVLKKDHTREEKREAVKQLKPAARSVDEDQDDRISVLEEDTKRLTQENIDLRKAVSALIRRVEKLGG